jgi:outer membrane protein, heavy metal efflux system
MKGFRLAHCGLPLFLLFSAITIAENKTVVDHHDPISIDRQLTLQQVLKHTLDHYPDRLLYDALQQEADALRQRGNSWTAGASSLSAQYLDDVMADDNGYRQIAAQLQIPLWNWDQRDAGLRVADQAQTAVAKQSEALQLQVAGLVRAALWELALKTIRHQQSIQTLDIAAKLVQKIERRVELGDLPRADLLLAKKDYLEKRSLLAMVEANLMHARKNYTSLTGLTRIPENYQEPISNIADIRTEHPLLQSISARIERQQAELGWVKTQGSGQPNVQFGMQSERDQNGSRGVESAGIGFSIPFGGSAFLEPQIAQANIELTQLMAEREHLYRQLEKNLHEAQHQLEVDAAELTMATELKDIAEKHMQMTELSFAAGETNLLDLLNIQAQTQNAVRHAKEHQIQQQRNIAFYNQAVGVKP